MDYIRQKRNITYNSDSCKMYLRHDFCHKCAYCGAIEEALSLIPEAADKLFEKDHFLPQHDDAPDMHDYPNLFYSCTSCNNKKNAILLPLNPCSDDVFSGEVPHVQGGTEKTKYIFKGTSPKGEEYITALELNSRYHLLIRQSQQAWLQANAESWNILQDLRRKGKLDTSDLQQIAAILYHSPTIDPFRYICGGSKHAIAVAEACRYLVSNGYDTEIVFEENEMDIKVTLGQKTFWGTVRISESIKECRVKTAVLEERRKKNVPYGLFVYVPSTATMYFFEIDFGAVNWAKKEYRTSNYILL